VKVLLNLALESRHVKQIQAVTDPIEVIQSRSPEHALDVMPEIEVVCGELSREMCQRGKKLRWVQSWSAGVDGMLYPELVNSPVILTSAKGTVGVHLAEHAMALLLGLTRGIGWAVRQSDWDQRGPIRAASQELLEKTLGIVGLGGTGRALAVRAYAFGMRILAVDPEEVDVPDGVEACWGTERFYDLLAESDVVTICAPLTRETQGLFDREAFQRMREHALLINVSRGKIMEEAALVEALEQGWIAGAGLDVTPEEPLPQDHPLWQMENVLLTPHTAGGSPRRNDRMVALFCENLRRLLVGEPLLSVIDKQKGY